MIYLSYSDKEVSDKPGAVQAGTGTGGYTPEISYLDQAGMSFHWNEHAVHAAFKTPWGDRLVFLRGCDPITGISFSAARPTKEAPEEQVLCWRKGRRISCDEMRQPAFDTPEEQ